MSEALQNDYTYALPIESRPPINKFEARRKVLANTAISSELEIDSYETYIAEAKQHPLLNKEQEVNLAKIIEVGREASKILDSEQSLDDREEAELKRQIEEANQAHEEFTKANLLLVVSIAKRYKSQNSSLMDLIQEGNIGMMHAIDKFDWRKGFKFSTYATWWIKQAITRSIGSKSSNIYLPVSAKEKVNQYERLLGQGHILNKPLTDEDICAYMSITPEELDEIRQNRNKTLTLSLDSSGPGGEDNGEPIIMDKVMDKNTSFFDDVLITELYTSEMIEKIMSVLSPGVETEVITMRYGLDGKSPMTFERIAKVLNLNRAKVKQIERNAFQKVRVRLELN